MVFKTPHPDRVIPQLCVWRGTGIGCTCTLLWDRYLSALNTSILPRYQHSYWEMWEGGRVKVGAGIWWLTRDVVAKQGHGQPRHNTVSSCPRGRQEVQREGWGLRRGWPALCVEADTGARKAQGNTAPLHILLPSGWKGTFGARVCRGGCLIPTPGAGRMLSPGRKHTRCSWSRSCHRQDRPARGRRRRCRWRSRRPCGSRPQRGGRRLARGS